jgi:hypothetical protein
MSADPPELPGPGDPALDQLFRALTADGSPGELAQRDAALTMFRDRQGDTFRDRQGDTLRDRQGDRQGDSRGRPRRFRLASSVSMAAAVVIIGGIAGAAYSAALPAPVQHIAYHLLDGIGVPDAHGPAPSSSARGAVPGPSAGPASAVPSSARAAANPTTPAASAPASCPCQAGEPSGATAQRVLLTVARAQIPADGDDVFSGRLAQGGEPESGVQAQLFEHVDGGSGWSLAGSATTGRDGDVTLTVAHLTSNASFHLTGPAGTASPAVTVTVIPPVSLRQIPGLLAGTRILIATAGFANVGDVIVLQELSGTTWYTIRGHALGGDHQTAFTVVTPRSADRYYRVVIPGTVTHGTSVSGPLALAPR